HLAPNKSVHAYLSHPRQHPSQATHRLSQAEWGYLCGGAAGARRLHGDVVAAVPRASPDDGEVREAHEVDAVRGGQRLRAPSSALPNVEGKEWWQPDARSHE